MPARGKRPKNQIAPEIAAPVETDLRFGRILSLTVMALTAGYVILYAIGSFSPTSFLWGMNHLAFFQPAARYSFLLLAFAFAIPLVYRPLVRFIESVIDWLARSRWNSAVTLIPLGGAAAFLFYYFRISTDMYGDSRTLLTLLAGKTYSLADLFRLDIANVGDAEYREPLTRLIHQSIANLFHLDLKYTFQIMSALSGGFFIIMFTSFVLRLEGPKTWKVVFLVVGLTCGANQLFFGHVEDYTLIYLCIVLLLMFAWKFFDGKKLLPAMLLVFLIGTRLHSAMLFFIPSMVYCVCFSLRRTHPWFDRLLSPRSVLIAVGCTLVAALLAYYLVFHADRQLVGDQKERGEKIFLPVSGILPPPHNYSLISLNHISDILQEVMLTVSPGAVILCCLGIFFVRRVPWTNPRVVFFGLAAFYFLLFNCTVNPLLTPERDWDLLSLAAMPLTFFAIAATAGWFQHDLFPKVAAGGSIALAILSSTFFFLNADSVKANQRLRSIGIWSFKSYYLGSAYLINVGEMSIADPAGQIAARIGDLQLMDKDRSNPDLEYGFLCHKVGDAAYRLGEYDVAEKYYMKSYEEDPYNATAVKALAVISILGRRFDSAEKYMALYNGNINNPEILDFDGLVIAESAQYMNYLVSRGADSSLITAELAKLHFSTR